MRGGRIERFRAGHLAGQIDDFFGSGIGHGGTIFYRESDANRSTR
jgi:hypothetical protein